MILEVAAKYEIKDVLFLDRHVPIIAIKDKL